ncbi:hemoblobin-interacting domain-containing protein [Anaerotignum faecicola]
MKNKGMYRLLSGVLCTSVLLSSQAYAAASADYSDMPQNWSKEAMEFAVKNNFITGVGENKIAPKAALTRAQLAAILSRAMKTGAGDVSVLDNFTDADKNAWYAGAMAKAVELKIFYGDGDSIHPDRPVTRQELFTILVRAFSVTGGDESTLASYNDAGSISSWAKAAISAMIAQGYAAGYEDKTLRPAQQVTREEFAQLLHRMREHYSSSDTSEDKTETKTDDTAKTDETTKTNTKKPSGGGGGGSSSGGGSHGGGGSVTVNKIVEESKATVQTTDMGAWLPLVFADGYDMSKATVTVDGTDVTAALSKVTTDGTIAKLPLTGTPKQVVIKSGDKTQTINLNGSGAASVYTGKQYLPQRVLTHGAVAIWDYHLTNYDADGNIRKEPKTTTFDLNKSVNARAFYSPNAVLRQNDAADNIYKVSGEVIIKFNYNTAEEKAWFNGITTLQLAGYSERLESLNNNLEFNTKVATSNYGHYGQLTIELGQPNFFSNGRYYVRVKSKAGETVLVPIHVVNEKAPSMELTEMPESGKNLHFNVKDMTYGITSPIESVTLTDPNGKTEKLTYIEDYYLFGDTFVLYNDKENHLSHKGNYKLTISSNGFKTFETNFNVREGKEAEKTVVYQYAAYDVVTHATGGGSSSGGSSEDGGGSNTMPANLVFDTDLLANALLLHKMERKTADVEKIVNYWKYDIAGRDSVFDKGATDYYKYSSYITAVNTAQTKNASWLSYADYLKNAGDDAKNPNRPYAVKAILEDGLLGETQYNGDYGKLTAPDFMVGDAAEGRPVVLTTENKDYVGEIKGLYLNGDWRMLREDAYEIDKAAGAITIKAGVLKVGENTISIVATGYQKKTIKINNNKMKETDLTLSVNKESFKQGETATLTVNGSKGDFLKNLTGVALMKEGKVVKNVLYKGAEGSEAAYYEIDKNAADGNVLKLTLTAKEVEAGDYTVSLTANYYEEPLTVGFKVIAKDAETVTTPKVDSYALSKDSSYYRISFKDATGDELKAYLNSVEKVTVGSKEYTKQNSSIGNLEEDKFRVVASNPAYGSSEYDKLDLAAVGVDTSNDVTVVITAAGYADVTFTIAKTSSGGGTEQPETKTAPVVNEITEKASDGIYEVSFKTEKAQDTRDYLAAITEVTVGGVPYEASENTPKSGSNQFRSKSQWLDLRVLQLGSGGFATDGKATKIVVKAPGYKDLEISYGTDVTPPTKPESPEAKTAPEGKIEHKEADNYYQVSFNGNDVSDYLKAITSVKVGNIDYTATEDSTPTGKQYSLGIILPSLKLGADGFTGSGDITVTITATGYKDNVVTYTMPNSGSTDNGSTEEGKDYPTINIALTKVEPGTFSITPVYYRASFTGEDKTIEAYLGKINKVSVGTTELKKASSFYSSDAAKYKIGTVEATGAKLYVDFTQDLLSQLTTQEVTFEAEGYKTLKVKFTYTE